MDSFGRLVAVCTYILVAHLTTQCCSVCCSVCCGVVQCVVDAHPDYVEDHDATLLYTLLYLKKKQGICGDRGNISRHPGYVEDHKKRYCNDRHRCLAAFIYRQLCPYQQRHMLAIPAQTPLLVYSGYTLTHTYIHTHIHTQTHTHTHTYTHTLPGGPRATEHYI